MVVSSSFPRGEAVKIISASVLSAIRTMPDETEREKHRA